MQFLKQLAYDHGLEFVAFDYRGHGESSGDFLRLGVSDWLADTQAIMRDVVQSTNLVIVGAPPLALLTSRLLCSCPAPAPAARAAPPCPV